MWMVPEARTNPVTALMSVVLPAPLGPMRAVIWPGSAFMVTSLLAVCRRIERSRPGRTGLHVAGHLGSSPDGLRT